MFYDNSGLLIGHIEELQLKSVNQSDFVSTDSALEHLYEIKWNTLNAHSLNETKVQIFGLFRKMR